MKQKRVAAIHDISCFGKCSLTVALPILSAAGIEATVLPTAVLSTHTGGFTGYTFRDLTEDIRPIEKHWKSIPIAFDAVYSGYLGSFEQLELVEEFYREFKGPDTLILTDPVMADNGKLYASFAPEFPAGMAKLCGKADLIMPNITEATLMLGEEYPGDEYDRDYIEKLLKKLAELGPSQVVLTGVSFEEGKLGSASYDRKSGEFGFAFSEKIEGYYHGTGDVYGSALAAAILRGKPLAEAIGVAVDFTVEAIRRTKEAGTDIRFGVDFEESLPNFMKNLGISAD
ncbi:MAG: pyridoxamine kinase [Clostridia bacterium]|nr:pyridoxamine kinase [Clostridia bacterium]